MAILLGILLVIFIAAVSWAIVNFLVWLICLCFGLSYSLLIGTGVWLVIILIRWIFSAASNN